MLQFLKREIEKLMRRCSVSATETKGPAVCQRRLSTSANDTKGYHALLNKMKVRHYKISLMIWDRLASLYISCLQFDF